MLWGCESQPLLEASGTDVAEEGSGFTEHHPFLTCLNLGHNLLPNAPLSRNTNRKGVQREWSVFLNNYYLSCVLLLCIQTRCLF